MLAAFSPDGRRLVAVTSDRFHHWQGEDTAPQVFPIEPGERASLVVSVDGSRVAALDTSGGVAVFSLCSPAECMEALWRATSYCLSPAERRAKLIESSGEAAAHAAACRQQVDGRMAKGEYR